MYLKENANKINVRLDETLIVSGLTLTLVNEQLNISTSFNITAGVNTINLSGDTFTDFANYNCKYYIYNNNKIVEEGVCLTYKESKKYTDYNYIKKNYITYEL